MAETIQPKIIHAETWDEFESHNPNGPTIYVVTDETDPGIEYYEP